MRVQFAPNALGFLREDSRFRQLCVAIAVSRAFSAATLFVILANTFMFALADYSAGAVDPVTLTPDGGRSWRNAVLASSEVYFATAYVTEMCVGVRAARRERHVCDQ